MKKVTAAILVHNGKILIAKRKKNDPLKGKWEFPGGTVEYGETPEKCLRREIKEELDIDIDVGEFFGESIYQYDYGSIQLLAYRAYWITGEIGLMEHDDYEWVHIDRLNQYDLAPADIPLAEKIMKYDSLDFSTY
ncbi:MAG: (deoxy)nucleoside triphosphate pyrophosphohydrolase [Deltaproteobacteria bacterium]|jgi:8-oxo-dGTP diphosphatase|nr:(deoxy)nucleoside triphosphate pyrophosphohydrolase [Deltaproteobacteria bacterium]